MDEENKPLKELESVWGPAEAEVIKTFLESHGISCLFRGRVLQSVLPFTTDGLGQIKIFVLEKDYEVARALLDRMPKGEAIEEFGEKEDDEF